MSSDRALPAIAIRLQRGTKRLSSQGARSIVGFLAVIGAETDRLPLIVARLADYHQRLSPDMLHLVGADLRVLAPDGQP